MDNSQLYLRKKEEGRRKKEEGRGERARGEGGARGEGREERRKKE
ncbi:MAG: hypothetical protein ACRCT1_22890 [Microcoleaceae cyanobacterium]